MALFGWTANDANAYTTKASKAVLAAEAAALLESGHSGNATLSHR